jgi:alpha-galactosidase
MAKITFMGAGSTIFAKSVLGDSMLAEPLQGAHIALYDIDRVRLRESRRMLDVLNRNVNKGRARITAHCGEGNRRRALRGADYVVNAVQVGGYEPGTVIDFEVPKRYGLRQTIGDTLGIGGIFRALRTIPVVLDFARDMEAVCPDAWMLNYVNPMAMITGAVLHGSGVRAVGLCHSVQGCASGLLWRVGLIDQVRKLQWKVAGINHQGWLLEITDAGADLYPQIKRHAARALARVRRKGGRNVAEQLRKRHGEGWWKTPDGLIAGDMVRIQLMLDFGYYVTESSEHTAEYVPWHIKSSHPELIDELNIPLDEYPRRCIRQIEGWKKRSKELVRNPKLDHKRTKEYASYIMEAMETDVPFRIGGNVLNDGLITNLPRKACVEVPCLVDRGGVHGCFVGDLPEQCAALNRTNVNVQLLTVEAAVTGKRDYIYQAAMLDPHTAAELTRDEIRSLCDDLIAAHGDMLPKYA